MNCTLTINGVTINNGQSIRVFKKVFPQNHLATILFADESGVASLQFPKETTINRSVTIQDSDNRYLFRGFVADLLPKAEKDQQFLEMICAGQWYQFQNQVVAFNSVCGTPHEYADHEGIDPDEPNDYNVTGMVNSLPTNFKIQDDNKDWGHPAHAGNEWVSGAPNRYGLVVLKNLFRPAVSYDDTNGTHISGAIEDTRTDDDQYLEFYSNVADADTILYCGTKIARANIARIKVRTVVYNQYAFNAASYGYIYIYNYGTDGWEILQTMSQAGRTYTGLYEHTEAGLLLEANGTTNKYVSAAGEIKIRYLAGDSGIVGTIYHWIKILFLRVELVVTDYPALQFTITASTANTITVAEDISTLVDIYDFYAIGQLSSYLLDYFITTYDTWQALTTTNMAAGTFYFIKNWDYSYLPVLFRELIEIEKYDGWIDDSNDLHTQTSASATATGLRFDESTPNLQIIGFQGGAIGSQIRNRIMVQWANGIVTVNNAASQTTYLYVMTELAVDKSIKSSEDATRYANYLLARYQTPHLDLGVSMEQYTYLQVGQSVTVNLPSRNITNETYLIRELQYFFAENEERVLVTLAKGGSAIHRYQTSAEESALQKAEILRIQQQLAPSIGAIGAMPGSIPQISDEAWGANWDVETTVAPSKHAVYTKTALMCVSDTTMAADIAILTAMDVVLQAQLNPVPSLALYGSDGFAQSVNYGPVWACLWNDPNAQILANFYVPVGGSYKACILFSSSVDNVGKIASGLLSVSAIADTEALSWNLASSINFDITIPATANILTYQLTAAYTIGNNENVAVRWVKDDDGGNGGAAAAGSIYVRAIILIKQ